MSGGFDILPCGYLAFRDDGIIKESNITAASLVGYQKAELAGKNIETLLTVASRIFYNTHFFPLVKLHSRANEVFLSLRDKDNREIPVLVNAERHGKDSDYVIHCVFFRIDERKKYEQELLNAKREAENMLRENKQLLDLTKDLEQHALALDKQYQHQKIINENLLQFSKIVSHDLQEPIRKIQIFIDRITKDNDTALSIKGKALSSKVIREAERLRGLTKSLQEFLATDDEKTHTHVDLNAIIDAAKSRVINLRQFSDFGMEIARLPTIEGYEKQLELLFFHLIDNAIQFRSPTRNLEIKVNALILEENIFRISKDQYKYTEHLRISFEDNGIGIPEEYKDYVFDLLNKLDRSGSGVGIGLSLVKKIVVNHSGSIGLKSQAGVGTRFEIELPVKIKN